MVDVLIAGAGPAGSIAAIRLARAGARVLLVDRARFPRDKLCGDTLNPGALRLLDRAGLRARVEAVSRPLEGMLITGNGGVHVRGTYGPGLFARALTRRVLDQLLVDAAIAAGAQFQDGVRVRRPAHGRQRRTADGARRRPVPDRRRAAARIRVPAHVTIAADGRRSTLAFALGLASHPPAPRRWAVGAYFEGIAGLDTVGEMHVRGPHYIGVAPIGDAGLANVCLVTPAREGFADPARLLERHVAADPVLGPRAARRASRHRAGDPRPARRRRPGCRRARPAPRRRRRRLRRSDDRRRPALRDARRRARRRRGARRARGSRRSTRPAGSPRRGRGPSARSTASTACCGGWSGRRAASA